MSYDGGAGPCHHAQRAASVHSTPKVNAAAAAITTSVQRRAPRVVTPDQEPQMNTDEHR
jgi:hypothetical protein